MKRLINILDIIGDESCLSDEKFEALYDNAPELSAFPVEYEMHYLDGVPDNISPHNFTIAFDCTTAVYNELCKLKMRLTMKEERSCLRAIKADAIAYEEKNWHLLFADDTFEKSWLEDENYEEY